MIPYLIEENIFQNGYINPNDIELLKSIGITHLLNLHYEYPFLDELIKAGFIIKQIFLLDPAPITDEEANEITDFIHNSIKDPEHKIYVHCDAGFNRSPTVIWLYYLSIGYSEEEATKRIISGHKNLVVPDPFIISNLKLDIIKNRNINRS